MALKNRIIETIYRLKDQFTGQVSKITSALGTVERASDRTATSVEASNRRTFKSFGGLGSALTSLKIGALSFVAAIGGIISQIGKWTQAAAIQERAETKLETTLKNLTGATREQIQALKEQASALQQVTGYGDEQTISAQAMLGTFQLTADQISVITPRLLDMAEASRRAGSEQVDLEAISIAIGKAFTSGIGSLTRYGVALSDAEKEAFKLADQQGKVDVLINALDNNFKGLAASVGDTYEGALRKADAAQGDFYETLGQLFTQNKAFVAVQQLLGKTWDKLAEGIKGSATEIGAVITTLAGVATVGFNAIRATWNALQIAFKTGAVVITTALQLIASTLSLITFGELSKNYAKVATDIKAYTADLKKGIIDDFGDIGESVDGIESAFTAPEKKVEVPVTADETEFNQKIDRMRKAAAEPIVIPVTIQETRVGSGGGSSDIYNEVVQRGGR